MKAGILPPVHENELKGEGERKTLKGAAKFKTEFETLSRELASMNLPDNTTAAELLHPTVEVVDDYDHFGITEKESESTIDANNENEMTEEYNDNDEAADNADDKLINISLTEAKKYAAALHHFVVDNMDQPQLAELSEASYKLAKVVNRMVDSSTKRQREIDDYFHPNSSSSS